MKPAKEYADVFCFDMDPDAHKALVGIVEMAMADARRAALEEAIGICEDRARRCGHDEGMGDYVRAYGMAADMIRALLDAKVPG